MTTSQSTIIEKASRQTIIWQQFFLFFSLLLSLTLQAQNVTPELNFLPARSFAAGFKPVGVAVGDFNRDGRLDLVVTNRFSGISVLLGDGVGGFAPATFLTPDLARLR